ncbi:serine hydrolase domain-containing protein, partial [Mumia zhuanghuii]
MRRLRPLLVSLTASLLSLAALLAPPQAHAQAPAELDRRDVDTFVTDYLARHGLPGATVAVVHDGKTVLTAGYGHDADGAALDEQSRMRIASVSKSFTAFAVLQLVDAGVVDLDVPVATYVDDFAMDDPRAADVTVRQLLSHTSGIPSPIIIGPADSLEEGAARVASWTLAADPGTSYLYSNANYWLAAQLVETVSGMPFADYLEQKVFAPLGMVDSESVVTTREAVDDLAQGHVTAYGLAFATREPEQMDAGAGSVVSTATDMAAWLAMQQRGGTTPNGQRLLDPTLVELSHTPQPDAGRHGLGWRRSTSRSPERIGASGVLGTFNAQQDLVPDSGYGVVVMLNSFTPTREHAYEMSTGIIALTEGKDVEVGLPVATLVDLFLGALTVLAVALGALGLRRHRRWVARRAAWPLWRFVLRLLPQTIAPALAIFVVLVTPALQGNSLTPSDTFRIFPSLTVLLTTLGVVGATVTAARVRARFSAPGR